MKKITLLLVLVLLLSFVVGCQEIETEFIVIDREGNEVVLDKIPERIISTAPSNTKILLSLGLGEKIIGVSNYDNIVDPIDSEVLKIDFRSPDLEAILEADPDLIIASGHNKKGGEDPFKLLKDAGVSVVYIPSSSSIEGIYGDIEFIASVTGTEEEGNIVISEMRIEIEKIKKLAETIKVKKTVYFEIAPTPTIYTTGIGTFQNDIISYIGAINAFEDQTGWFSPSVENIIEMNPDVIITNVSYVENAVDEILNRPGFEAIDAVNNGFVYQIDGDMTSQPAPQVIDALWEMGRLVYPEVFK